MKITDISVHLLTAQWTEDAWFPQMLFATALIRITTDSGEEGLGETTLGYFTPETVVNLVEYFKPLLVGQDPLQTSRLASAMWDDALFWVRAGAGLGVISGIEIALWDLKGKALGVPVYQLLGGAVRDRIPVYASGGPTLWPLDDTVAKVASYAAQGYRATKLSTDFYRLPPPSSSMGQTRMEVVAVPFADSITRLTSLFERLRREFGGEMDLAIDGHQGATPHPIPVTEAIEISNALAPYRLRFYEEPLAYTNLDAYRELRARSRIPVAGGESMGGLDQFHGLTARGCVDIIQPDVGFAGGLQETVRIIHDAEAHNITTAIHTGASMGPSFAASWHITAAFQSVEWLEHVVAARGVHRDLLQDSLEVTDGTIGLPSAPGLGTRLTPELLEKYRFVPGSGERA